MDRTRSDLADQSHPHEERARLIQRQIQGTTYNKESFGKSKQVKLKNLTREKQREITKQTFTANNNLPGNVSSREELTMSVNMTPSQKIAFEKYMTSKAWEDDSDDEEHSSKLVEYCPYGCNYRTSTAWLMKAHLSKCPGKGACDVKQADNSSLQNDYAKYLVQSFERTVKSSVDDNLNYLTPARFWPAPASMQAMYAAMPIKAEPVRYNYNSSEWGITINNQKTVLAMHDRTNTSLTLKMFPDHALAKHEENQSWKPGRKGNTMIMNDEFEEIRKPGIAMQALNNFRTIHQKIWPLDSSVDTLFNVVWRQSANVSYPPQVQDISELFSYWIQERAQAALGNRPPMSYFNLQSHMNSLCQRRGPSTLNQNIPTMQGYENTNAKSGKKGLKFHPYERPYGKDRKVDTIEDKTCSNFNSPKGCPKQIPDGGSCSGRFGKRWMHLCNMYDSSTGKFCMEPHTVMEHK